MQPSKSLRVVPAILCALVCTFFFLACNGEFDIREPFEIYEAITLVSLGESTTQSILVLPYTLFQRGADTCIKRAPGRVAHLVNAG